MNKSLLFAALAATSVAFTSNLTMADAPKTAQPACKSCCCAKPSAQKYIGKEAAIAAALAHAGLERAAVRDLKCELDRENGIMVYEVEFESGIYDYEYDIDAATGKILKSKKELD
jgi:uncharacterized membrane protein YkoI